MVPRSFLLAIATTALVACASTPKHALSVAVLVEGDRAAVGSLAPRAVAGLELRTVELPAPAVQPVVESSAEVTRARAAYARGDFDSCRAELAKVDVVHLLVATNRALAARLLTLDAACAWGALAKADAKTAARRLASLGLELPETIVAPDVEQMIGAEIAAHGKSPRHALAIRGEVGGRISIDGRPAGCSIPCTLEVAPGDHVLAIETDGFMPASRLVRTPETTEVSLAQQPASPELAARQWRARIGRGLPPTEAVGIALVATLARDQRVAVVHAGKQLEGTLIVDGVLRARVMRAPGEGEALVRDLAYDGGVLQRPSLLQRPWFWIALSSAAIAIAGAIVYVTYEPDVRTGITL